MSVPASQIPPHPGVAAAAAAAGPAVRVATDNTTIPGNPAIAAQIANARGIQAPAQAPAQNLGQDFDGDGDGAEHSQADWFGAAATGAQTPERHLAPPTAPPAAPVNQGQPQQTQPSYSEIDAMLEGIPLPGEIQGQQPQPGQGQPQVPQQPQAPSSQPQQIPVAAPQVTGAAPPQVFDAEAAQKVAIDQLMGREYQLSEVDERRLIAEPEKVIPRLAAQVHVNVVRDIGQRFGQIVPEIVNRLVEQRLAGMRHETEFYSRFPKLNNPVFRPIVEESLRMVKAANPNITQEQLQNEGAQFAAFKIRQHYRTQALPPAAPPMRATQIPYVPMSPGAPSVPMAPPSGNAFADLANATDLFDW